MLFRKILLALTLFSAFQCLASEDVSDEFSVYRNTSGLIYLESIGQESNLPLGYKAEWLDAGTLEDKYRLESQYDDYILSISSLSAEKSTAEVPGGYARVSDYKVYKGEFDNKPGADFLVWIEGIGVILFSPHSGNDLQLLDTSSLNGALDLTEAGISLYVEDRDEDGVDDVLVVHEGKEYQFLANGQGFSAGAEIATQQYVGEVEANLTVTPSGALSYQIPVEVPPGINGLQPNISLNYNSRSGNGIAGVGWSVAGLDMFHLCGSDYVHDGKVLPVTLTDKDNICFNGQRVFGDRTEFDAFNDIKAIDGGYQVRTKGGLLKTYTNAASLGGVDYQWLLQNVRDKYNNKIEYHYDILDGVSYLADVEYSSGKITFIYSENRLDSVERYLAGQPLVMTRLLTSINVYGGPGNSRLVKEYSLKYYDDDFQHSPRKHLQSVSYCASSSKGIRSCKPDLVFDWQHGDTTYNELGHLGRIPMYTLQTTPVDWNGDGLKDLLIRSELKISIVLNDGSSFGNEVLIKSLEMNHTTAFSFVASDFFNMGTEGILFRDVEFVDGTQLKQKQTWFIKQKGAEDVVLGDAFNIPGAGQVAGGVYPGMDGTASPLPVVEDLNGDGLVDLILPYGSEWVVKFQLPGHKFGDSRKIADISRVVSVSYAGRATSGENMLIFANTSTGANPDKYSLVKLSDVGGVVDKFDLDIPVKQTLLLDYNGDGLVDILSSVNDEKVANIQINKNAGWGVFEKISTDIRAEQILPPGDVYSWFLDTNMVKIADINHDGMSDVVYKSFDGFQSLISNGHDFKQVNLNLDYSGYGSGSVDIEAKPGCDDIYNLINNISILIKRMTLRYSTEIDRVLTIDVDGKFLPDEVDIYTKSLDAQKKDVTDLISLLQGGSPNLLEAINVEGFCYTCDSQRILDSVDNLNVYSKSIDDLNELKSDSGVVKESKYYANKIGHDRTWARLVVPSFNDIRCLDIIESSFQFGNLTVAPLHQVVDFTGDGIVDVLKVDYSDMSWEIWKSNIRNDLVSSISTAFNKTVNIKYTTPALADSYGKGLGDTSGLTNDVIQPFSLVSNVSVVDRTNPAAPVRYSDLEYTYKGFKYHTQGRGFLGASERSVTNVLTDQKELSQYRQDFPYIGLTSHSESYASASQHVLTEQADYKWTHKTSVYNNGSQNSPNRYTPLLSASATQKFDLQGNRVSSQTVENDYDDYGNNISRLTRLWDASSSVNVDSIPTKGYIHSEQITSEYPIDKEQWLIANMASSTRVVSKSGTFADANLRNTADRTTRTEYVYYPDTLSVKSKITYPDASDLTKSISDSFSYNANGVLNSSRSNGNDFAGEQQDVKSFLNNQYPAEVFSSGYRANQFFEYDPVLGKPVRITDYNGKVSTIDYDAFGREIRNVAANGVTTQTHYVSCADVTACQLAPEARYKVMVDTGGAPSSEVYYDALGREVLKRTQLQFDQQWQSVKTEYTKEGYVSRVSVPYTGTQPAAWTAYTEYDALGRAGRITHPDGGAVGTLYSSENGLQKTTVTETISKADDGTANRVVNRFYDARGLLVKKVEAVNTSDEISIQFDYDALGNRDWVQINGKAEETTTSIFDNSGNPLRINDPSTGTTTYTYAANGNLLTKKDAMGLLTTYSYDSVSRPTMRRTERNGSGSILSTWSYDLSNDCQDSDSSHFNQLYIGKICREYRSDGAKKYYRYDERGNLAYVKEFIGGSSQYSAIYDEYSRLRSETLDSGVVLNYQYQNGYLNSISTQGRATPLWLASAGDAYGHVTEFNLGNGLKETDNYSTSGRLESRGVRSSANSILDNTYRWNSDGTLYSREWKYPATNKETFTYDTQKRLTSAVSDSVTRYNKNYYYESNGNIRHKTEITGDLKYGENGAGPYAVTTAGNTSYVYDANGNMISRDPDGSGPLSGNRIKYDYYNKPISIGDDKGVTTFQYRADLSRFRKIRTENNGEVLRTDYVNDGRVEKRYSPTANVLERITYIGDFAQLTEYGTTQAFADNTQSKTWYYLHRDHLGSIEAITNEQGNIALSEGVPQYFSYDAFGQPRSSLGDITNRGFTDHEHLPESGLIHMNGRVYDPLISRFLSADIVVQAPDFSQSYNRYSYVMNSPMSFIDPSGYRLVYISETDSNNYVYTFQAVQVPASVVSGDIAWNLIQETAATGQDADAWKQSDTGKSFWNMPLTQAAMFVIPVERIFLWLKIVKDAAVAGRTAERASEVKNGVVIAPGKFDYIFGRVSSDPHNAARSKQLAQAMERLGVPDTAAGRQMLIEHLNDVVKSEENIVRRFSTEYGNFEVRESLFMGPSGKASMFESTFRFFEDGSREFSTVITFY